MSTDALKNKNVLLIGGGGILGSKIAEAILAAGGILHFADINVEKGRELASFLGENAHFYPVDVTCKISLYHLHKTLAKKKVEVDVLINAAVKKSKNFFAPFEEFPREDWEEVFEVNTTGTMLSCQVFGGDMAARGKGAIINILSIYGIVAPDQRIYEGSEYEGRAINTPAVYSASKAAVWGLTHYLSTYWGEKGVRVNAVTPGGIYSGQNETFVNRYSQRVPLGRMAKAEEVASAIVYLASDSASYVTGQNLVVDGGLTVW